MALKSIFGAVCAYVFIAPTMASATTVWAADLRNDEDIWTMYLVTTGDRQFVPEVLTGVYIDALDRTGETSPVDPADLLVLPPSRVLDLSGDPYDIASSDGADFLFDVRIDLDLPESFLLVSLFSAGNTQPIRRGIEFEIRCDSTLCRTSLPFLTRSTVEATALSFTSGFTPVASSVVPVPPAVWLFSSGLLGLIGIARRKKE